MRERERERERIVEIRNYTICGKRSRKDEIKGMNE